LRQIAGSAGVLGFAAFSASGYGSQLRVRLRVAGSVSAPGLPKRRASPQRRPVMNNS